MKKIVRFLIKFPISVGDSEIDSSDESNDLNHAVHIAICNSPSVIIGITDCNEEIQIATFN